MQCGEARAATDVETLFAAANFIAQEVFPQQETGGRRWTDLVVAAQLGYRQREQVAPTVVLPFRALAGVGQRGVGIPVCRVAHRRERPRAGQRFGHRCDVGRPHPAAAAEDASTLRPPDQRHVGVFRRADGLVEAPGRIDVAAEVRIDAEWQVGKVGQPGQRAGHAVHRQAVDEQRADANLLEFGGETTEVVALRIAPQLAVNSANAVATAAKTDPHGQAGVDQESDGVARTVVLQHGQRFEEHEVGRFVAEATQQQLHCFQVLVRDDVAAYAEGDGTLVAASQFADGLSGDAHRVAREIHPVHGACAQCQARHPAAGRIEDAVGVGRDDVAARLDVALVYVGDGLGHVLDGFETPVVVVRQPEVAGAACLQFGRHCAVENDAAVAAHRRLEC